MAQQTINIGAAVNDGTGDQLRTAFTKTNANFTELYTSVATKQAEDADLTAIAALTGTTGFLKKSAANTWTLDTNTYLTGIDADLTAIAALTGTTGFLKKSAANTWTLDTTNYISLAALKTVVAASTDFANFKTRIAAL